jgi:hypothetical protein
MVQYFSFITEQHQLAYHFVSRKNHQPIASVKALHPVLVIIALGAMRSKQRGFLISLQEMFGHDNITRENLTQILFMESDDPLTPLCFIHGSTYLHLLTDFAQKHLLADGASISPCPCALRNRQLP